MTDPQQPSPAARVVPSIQDIFGDTPPMQSADDLAVPGMFENGEVEEFLADLHTMRRADLA